MIQTAESKWANLSSKHQADLDKASDRIAPSWPLDRSIAVNPLWQMRDLPVEEVSAKLAALADINCLMPIDYYLELLKQKKINMDSLQEAAQKRGLEMEPSKLLAYLSTPSPKPRSFQTIATLSDSQRSRRLISWHDEITFQISQFCAAYYQKKESYNHPSPDSLYEHWLRAVRLDHGINVLMGEPHLRSLFRMLPQDVDKLLALALCELKLDGDILESYAHALLLDINGWASWIAYLDFHNPGSTQNRKTMRELLGIRMAWELVIWLLYKDHPTMRLGDLWENQKRLLPQLIEDWKKCQFPLWVWSSAIEIEYQKQLHEKLTGPRDSQEAAPFLQAVFCIDVRSEPMRRALESYDPSIQTFGCAGFFGLPLSFEPADSLISRPQVPGLIKPSLSAEEKEADAKERRSTWRKGAWESWAKAAPSGFFMVEATGWLYLGKLLKRSFLGSVTPHPINRLSHRMKWILRKDGRELLAAEKAKLAGAILKASGLHTTAPWVLLIGHGSQSCNNPQAAALDCGACGGQTGEVNVRVLASLLNDPEVRRCLADDGQIIDPSTRFIAGFHNTTIDELSSFEEDIDLRIINWLKGAATLARRERIASLNPERANDDNTIAGEMKKRASDWSEIRPEWGLANNAAFIVAPRNWTRSLDLGGRCFLHDYDWRKDPDFSLLEMVMTAPMVVTHWINMQYNSSVTDNQKYGSGNKVLHNVVGGNIGIFEGNGGDLRIGLAMQSLHDGEKWMHSPQRLSVYIAAPAEAISKIVGSHETIRVLIQNEWLYLFQWDQKGVSRIGPHMFPNEGSR